MAEINEILADARASQTRDEKGRFASVPPTERREEEKPEAAQASEPVTPTPVETPAEVATTVTPVTATPLAPVVSDAEQAYKKAMREEREKRQNAERALREFQQRATAPPVDPWADLPGYLQSQGAQLREELFVERCNLTEEIARGQHTDYDEVRESFLEEAQANPALMAQLRNERNPAAYAYREGLRIRELKEVNGDFVAYRAKIEKATEERIRRELSGQKSTTPAVPASLNSEGSPAVIEGYNGPKSLKEILGKKF